MTAKRVFWYGAHKVLKRTELRLLRQLGFEVFNPAYLTSVYDQSADKRIDADQPTTLPREVFEELLNYDFFYRELTPRIAELLNVYFDSAVVTISSDWLKSFLAGFNGRVIYRIYGQHFSLSEKIVDIGLWERLVSRDGFCIIPFAEESVENEALWFRELCSAVVPYQIPDDVFDYSGTWDQFPHRSEIATSIPNILNPYFAAAYAQFNARYPHRLFRIYGPQRSAPADSRIVGALDRSDQLRRFASSAGFLYDYRDQVCYLPPVEMMELGGPVLYAPGSLLDRFYHGQAPGLVRDAAEAELKIGRLLANDRGFIGEVQAAQEQVRRRYDRKVVEPLFAETFKSALGGPLPPSLLVHDGPIWFRSRERPSVLVEEPRPTVWIMLHADGLISYQNGKPFASQGIPRVMEVIVDALTHEDDYDVVITCTGKSLAAFHDFFEAPLRTGRLRLRVVQGSGEVTSDTEYDCRLLLIDQMNQDCNLLCALIPHYYLFPECLLLSRPTILYLPDYFPHLMPGVVFDTSAEKDAENKEVGVRSAGRASAILTNSAFTAGYLSDAGFVDPSAIDKIIVAPLPLLGARHAEAISDVEEAELLSRLAGRRFIFYPTANRPNKQLAFLLRVFALVRMEMPDLALVLTGSLGSVPGVGEAANRYRLNNDIVLLHGLSEGSLRWLYQHAAVMCLTSTLEGNFPPQIFEALEYGAPVVATRLPPIADALGSLANELLLCDPLDLEGFTTSIGIGLSDRDLILERQKAVVAHLRERNSLENFYGKLKPVLDGLSVDNQ